MTTYTEEACPYKSDCPYPDYNHGSASIDKDELEQKLLSDKLFQHILKFAPQSQRELMTFELARYFEALISAQITTLLDRLEAQAETMHSLGLLYGDYTEVIPISAIHQLRQELNGEKQE